MSAIAFELPPEVREACEGLTAFARSEVMPRHDKHRALLEDPRKLYREDGRFSDEAIALIKEVRKAASRAGFYTMCVPEPKRWAEAASVIWLTMSDGNICSDCVVLRTG